MPKKPTKWGIKAWVLADSRSGYVWNLNLYTGKNSNTTTNNDNSKSYLDTSTLTNLNF